MSSISSTTSANPQVRETLQRVHQQAQAAMGSSKAEPAKAAAKTVQPQAAVAEGKTATKVDARVSEAIRGAHDKAMAAMGTSKPDASKTAQPQAPAKAGENQSAPNKQKATAQADEEKTAARAAGAALAATAQAGAKAYADQLKSSALLQAQGLSGINFSA